MAQYNANISERQQPRRKTAPQRNHGRSSSETHRIGLVDRIESNNAERSQFRAEDDTDQAGENINGMAMEVDETPAPSHEEATLAAHPLREMADRVGREVEEFAERLDAWKPKHWGSKSADRASAFELVKEYRTLADSTVTRLKEDHTDAHRRQLKRIWREKLDPGARSDSDVSVDNNGGLEVTTLDDLHSWQAELNTWRLLEEMGPSAFPDDPSLTSATPQSDLRDYGNDRFAADGDPWADFLAGDTVARNRLLILKWLEESAGRAYGEGEMVDLIQDEMKHCSERGEALFSKGWIDTRERLKAEKLSNPWDTGDVDLRDIESSDGQLLIQQLDPDAPTRLQGVLEKADRTFENSVWLLCWQMMRCGMSMDKVRDWCEEHNEIARAVTLGAYAAAPFQDDRQQQNAAVRYRWRRTCQAAATRCRNEHERALLGLISGDFGVLEAISDTWEDLCFARYNALLIAQYKTYLRGAYPNAFPPEQLYSFGESEAIDIHQTPAETLNSIRKHAMLGNAEFSPQATIQQSIIAGNIAELLFRQGVLLARKAKANEENMLVLPDASDMLNDNERITNLVDDINSLRVLAHTFMIVSYLGLTFESESHRQAAENVFIAYIDFLLLAGKDQLIPVYAAKLPMEQAVYTLARVLPCISNNTTRQQYVTLTKEYQVPIILVLRATYEDTKRAFMIEVDDSPAFKSYNSLEPETDAMWPGARVRGYEGIVNTTESLILQSLDWYALIDHFWYQSFETLTDAAILLLENGRVEAAAALFDSLPAYHMSMAKSGSTLGKRLDIFDDDDPGIDVGLPGEAYSKSSHRRRSSSGSRKSLLPTDEQKAKRRAMKQQAACYYELNQLVDAIKALWTWREAEDDAVNNTRPGQKTAHQVRQTHENTQIALENLGATMSAILVQDFLTTPPPPNHTQPLIPEIRPFTPRHQLPSKDRLANLRQAYVPSLILAYNSALDVAGHLVSRDCFLQAIGLADVVANDEELTRCFVHQGRMRELVRALALTSKIMLRLNEGKSNASKRRGRGPKTLAVWDIDV